MSNNINEIKGQEIFYTDLYRNIELNLPLKCVLIGNSGSGKTTLFNKITGYDQQVKQGGYSATSSIATGEVGGIDKFTIFDYPEIQEENIASIYKHLCDEQVNRIFIIVKFDRLGIVKEQIEKFILKFQNWLHLISVVITHFDLQVDPEKRLEQYNLYSNMIKNYFTIDSMIFLGILAEASQIKSSFYRNLSDQKIIMSEQSLQEFQKNFNFNENSLFQFKEYQKKYLNQYEMISQQFQKLISEKKFYYYYDKNEYIESVLYFLKDYSEQLCQQFMEYLMNSHPKCNILMNYLDIQAQLKTILGSYTKQFRYHYNYQQNQNQVQKQQQHRYNFRINSENKIENTTKNFISIRGESIENQKQSDFKDLKNNYQEQIRKLKLQITSLHIKMKSQYQRYIQPVDKCINNQFCSQLENKQDKYVIIKEYQQQFDDCIENFQKRYDRVFFVEYTFSFFKKSKKSSPYFMRAFENSLTDEFKKNIIFFDDNDQFDKIGSFLISAVKLNDEPSLYENDQHHQFFRQSKYEDKSWWDKLIKWFYSIITDTHDQIQQNHNQYQELYEKDFKQNRYEQAFNRILFTEGMQAYFILNKKVKEICENISQQDEITVDFIENNIEDLQKSIQQTEGLYLRKYKIEFKQIEIRQQIINAIFSSVLDNFMNQQKELILQQTKLFQDQVLQITQSDEKPQMPINEEEARAIEIGDVFLAANQIYQKKIFITQQQKYLEKYSKMKTQDLIDEGDKILDQQKIDIEDFRLWSTDINAYLSKIYNNLLDASYAQLSEQYKDNFIQSLDQNLQSLTQKLQRFRECEKINTEHIFIIGDDVSNIILSFYKQQNVIQILQKGKSNANKKYDICNFPQFVALLLDYLTKKREVEFQQIKSEKFQIFTQDQKQLGLKNALGCVETCPNCGAKCKIQNNGHKDKHQIKNHRTIGVFGFYKKIYNQIDPYDYSCTSSEVQMLSLNQKDLRSGLFDLNQKNQVIIHPNISKLEPKITKIINEKYQFGQLNFSLVWYGNRNMELSLIDPNRILCKNLYSYRKDQHQHIGLKNPSFGLYQIEVQEKGQNEKYLQIQCDYRVYVFDKDGIIIRSWGWDTSNKYEFNFIVSENKILNNKQLNQKWQCDGQNDKQQNDYIRKCNRVFQQPEIRQYILSKNNQ